MDSSQLIALREDLRIYVREICTKLEEIRLGNINIGIEITKLREDHRLRCEKVKKSNKAIRKKVFWRNKEYDLGNRRNDLIELYKDGNLVRVVNIRSLRDFFHSWERKI